MAWLQERAGPFADAHEASGAGPCDPSGRYGWVRGVSVPGERHVLASPPGGRWGIRPSGVGVSGIATQERWATILRSLQSPCRPFAERPVTAPFRIPRKPLPCPRIFCGETDTGGMPWERRSTRREAQPTPSPPEQQIRSPSAMTSSSPYRSAGPSRSPRHRHGTRWATTSWRPSSRSFGTSGIQPMDERLSPPAKAGVFCPVRWPY